MPEEVIGPHPDPPADLGDRTLPIHVLPPPWFRSHRFDHAPLRYGRSRRTRFGDPDGEFGVLYMGADAHAAFVETFGRATGSVAIRRETIKQRAFSVVAGSRPLRLVDLRGPGLARLGADARLFAGEYGPARAFARALWNHPARPDGILYPARHDPSRQAIALFEREDREDLDLWADTMPSFDVLGDILDTYGWAVLPDG